MVHRESRPTEIWSTRRARLALGTPVRVENANGHSWAGQVTSISDRIVGLRGGTIISGQFLERDTVTLTVGVADRVVSGRAQVLSISGSLMRLVRRDSYSDADQRRAPRLRVDLTATVTVHESHEPPPPFEANITDLSSSGCALSSTITVVIGEHLDLRVHLPTGPLPLSGTVVRTWTSDTHLALTGVQFDTPPAHTAQLLNRFLIEQITAGQPPEHT